MLVQILQLLGTDERALRIARRLTFLEMWLSETEMRWVIVAMNRAIKIVLNSKDRAA